MRALRDLHIKRSGPDLAAGVAKRLGRQHWHGPPGLCGMVVRAKKQQFPKIFVASGGATGLTTKPNFSQVVYLTLDTLITSTP